MIKKTIECDIGESEWDAFVARSPYATFLQSAAWGRFKGEWGWACRRVAIREGGELIAGAQLLFRRLPLGRSVAYLPRGPLAAPDDVARLRPLFDEIHRVSRREGALLLTVEPHWACPEDGAATLQRLGFRPSRRNIQPATTLAMDLRPDEEAILGQMHQKWRYNIRLAGRKEVTVRVGDERDFDLFHALTVTTGERDAFAVRPRDYYADAWRAFQPDQGRLFVAEFEGAPLGAIMVVRAGPHAVYLYGASSNEERNRMPNHLLQWTAMQWAKEQGSEQYDFWGIPDEIPASGQVETLGTGGLWGVFRFKQGFGGQVIKYPGAFDFVYSRPGYLAYQQYQKRRGGEH